jgi:hypothetical protein
MADIKLARRMLKCFEGYDQAYGSYDHVAAAVGAMHGGKVEIKATAYTKRGLVTAEMWLDHLNGVRPLGVIPIRDNNTCLWGCIDIDQYDIEPVEILKLCRKAHYPIIGCASKSNGLHLFVHVKDPVTSAGLQFRLKEMAAMLKHGGAEVFPKQHSVALERGDLGSWLNMPYFGDTRRAYNDDGTFMSLEEFLSRIETEPHLQPATWIDGPSNEKHTANGGDNAPEGSGIDFKDGPPCMQYLSSIGLGPGSRNNGIMAMGIFAKKKYPRKWKEVLEQWNRDYAQPPLPASEMVDIIKRLEQKNYFYPCKDQPIVAHCNSALCRIRKYGVGSETNEMPVVGGLTKLNTDEPLWFLTVRENRLEFTTEALMNYRAFQKVCVIEMNVLFKGMKQADWDVVVSALLAEVTIIDAPPEVGLVGQFVELLEEFVNNKHRAKSKEDILLGRPWLDDTDEHDINHKYIFRLKDLQKYLNDANFKIYTRSQMIIRMKHALGGQKETIRVKDEGEMVAVRCWSVPKAAIQKSVSVEPPAVPPGAI